MTEQNWQRFTIAKPPPRQYTDFCPDCGGGMRLVTVPCPDGVPGCLVLHYAYMCSMCGALWNKSATNVVDDACKDVT